MLDGPGTKDIDRPSTAASASLIAGLYRSALAPERRAALLDDIAEWCGAAGAWIVSVSQRDEFDCRVLMQSAGWRVASGTASAWATTHAHHEAVHLRRIARARPGTIHSDALFTSDRAGVASRPDVAFLRAQLGVFDRCGVRLDDDPIRSECLILFYSAARVGPTEAERDTLLRLWPHVAQSFALAHRFDRLQARHGATLSLLDKVDAGLMVVLDDARVVVANASARQLLDRRAEIGIADDGQLVCRDSVLDERLRSTIRAAAGEPGGAPSVRSRISIADRAAAPCLIECRPLDDDDAARTDGPRAVLIGIVDTGVSQVLDAGILVEAYGLTDAEEGVATLTIDGRTNDEIADLRSVSVETVRSQVASTLRKCRVRNRAELVRRAATLRIALRD